VTDLAGRTAVVTGASSGIGASTAHKLAGAGARVAVGARRAERLEELVGSLPGEGHFAHDLDVTDDASARAFVDAAAGAFAGRIDVLVNNAGMSMWSRLDELQDLSVYETLMRINYLGCVYLTHAALPHLKRSRGRIVVVASLAGLTGVPTRTGYAASKHAVVGFFESLRIELADTGVSVTLIAPDFVVSEIHRRSLGPDGRPLGASPLQEGKLMTAEECAARIVRAAERRQRLAILSLRGRLGRFVRLVSPRLIDRIADRAVRQGR
jgi:NADP-dependent 3-hydroxy acid dehydrogenase YdfG